MQAAQCPAKGRYLIEAVSIPLRKLSKPGQKNVSNPKQNKIK